MPTKPMTIPNELRPLLERIALNCCCEVTTDALDDLLAQPGAPSPASACADHSEDARHMVRGVPVYQLQCREIGEGDWCPTDLRHYTYCQKSPEMDTRIVEVAPASDVVQVPRELLKKLLADIDRNTCTHEETYRAGIIWEICNSCGSKWADDEGGRPEFEWPAEIEAARGLLAARTGQEV